MKPGPNVPQALCLLLSNRLGNTVASMLKNIEADRAAATAATRALAAAPASAKAARQMWHDSADEDDDDDDSDDDDDGNDNSDDEVRGRAVSHDIVGRIQSSSLTHATTAATVSSEARTTPLDRGCHVESQFCRTPALQKWRRPTPRPKHCCCTRPQTPVTAAAP